MNDLSRAALVFLGAGAGGVARFFVDRAVHLVAARDFPSGTMLINITGSLMIGVLYEYLGAQPPERSEPWRLLLMTGILGGFTTFSAFSRETISLLEQKNHLQAGLYVFLSVTLSILAAGLAMKITSRLIAP